MRGSGGTTAAAERLDEGEQEFGRGGARALTGSYLTR